MASYDAPAETLDALTNATGALTHFIDTKLVDLAHRFSATYSELARTSLEHFLVTPVTALPTGKEKGKFLSIDVGGTNLRVGIIELLTGGESGNEDEGTVFGKYERSHDMQWPIGDHLKMDQAEDLFDWIGSCIAEVFREAMTNAAEGLEVPLDDEVPLGITFSFPMAQTSLSEATLLPMGKGFAITSDLNLGKMLLAGYARHCGKAADAGHTETAQSNDKKKPKPLPKLRVAAITNDTVATFASLAYAVKAAPNSRVVMGLIVGTGTNATVPMKLDSLNPTKRKALPNPDAVDTVVVNTEWTIRGTDKPLIDLNIKTPWDLMLDAKSDAPGFQPFEYMTSGRYLGELVRLVFVEVVSSEAGTDMPPTLLNKNAIPTRFLSEVAARLSHHEVTQELNSRYPGTDPATAYWTQARVDALRKIANAVQVRSSALIAAACVGLLGCVKELYFDEDTRDKPLRSGMSGQTDLDELVIAYAGGTISQYPRWLETCQSYIDMLVDSVTDGSSTKRVVLQEALDGGIIGAGVLAGMAGEIH